MNNEYISFINEYNSELTVENISLGRKYPILSKNSNFIIFHDDANELFSLEIDFPKIPFEFIIGRY